MLGCLEKDELATSTDAVSSDAFIRDYSLNQSITANSKVKIDTSLFNIELLAPKLKLRLENIQYQYSKSLSDLNPEETGYPVWGAIFETEEVSIIPTLRPGLTLSYEFLVILTNELQQQDFVYVNGLENEEALRLIDILTFPILTEQSQQELYKLGGTTITGLDIVSGGGISENGGNNPSNSGCFTLTFYTEHCISVSQEGVGELCCKCEEVATSTIRCNGSSGGGGPSGGGSSNGGGGGDGGSNGGGSSNIDDVIAYLDSMRTEAPDQIVNNVDCAQNPCLCEVINSFSENPDLFENLSNEVSQLLQEIFSLPNFQSIIITTSEVEGFTLPSSLIARHQQVATGGFPIGGMAYSEIIFNSNYELNCTQAHLAATLLHESMHAYIDVQRDVLTPTQFTSLYPLFSTGYDHNNSHHITMANNFVGALSRSLHNMFPGLTDEFLQALSWQGLEGTPAYIANVTNLGLEPRFEKINNIASCQGDPNNPTPPLYPHELDALGLKSCF